MYAAVDFALAGNGRCLTLRAPAGARDLPALWLRERAPDPDTTDPITGQRLIEAASLPLDLSIERADVEGDRLAVAFSDGHRTSYSIDKLAEEVSTPAVPSGERILWDADLAAVPEADYPAAVADDQALSALLDRLYHYGFVRVSNVPTEPEGMRGLTDRIGPIRRTNWGGIADVKSVPQAFDLTMTQRGLEPHTDNPYRDPIPGYICLHCLTNAAEGGDSTLVDGFMAVKRLQDEAPQDFESLTTLVPLFRYVDAETYLQSDGPLIEIDHLGGVRRVRYSNRTERIGAWDSATLARYYAARQHFYRLITSNELTVHLKLDPGDMLIMDNYRLLHGRTAFRLEGGVRHMRQGYLDRDSVASRRRVLGATAHRGANAAALASGGLA